MARDSLRGVDIRAGTIVEVVDFLEARNKAYRLKITFGRKLGVKCSSAQITNYSRDELVGMKILCRTNVQPLRIAGFVSEVIVCGFYRK